MDGRAQSGLIESEGPERAHFLLEQLLEHARQSSIDMPFSANTGYVNTIDDRRRRALPRQSGNRRAPARLHALERHGHGGQGQPPSTRRMAATWAATSARSPRWPRMFGAGFNHFWHAESENHGGDLLYIQGHVSPGMYARALPGRPPDRGAARSTSARRWMARACRATRTQADARVLAVPHRVHGSRAR